MSATPGRAGFAVLLAVVATAAVSTSAGAGGAADGRTAAAGGATGGRATAADGSPCDGYPLRWTRADALAEVARERAEYGFPHDQAYLEQRARRVRRHGRLTWIVPYTTAEREYLAARDRLWHAVRTADEYMRRRAPGIAAGVSIEDAWPSPPFVRARFTRDVDAHVAAIRARLARPEVLHGLQVERSERQLSALTRRVVDDREALAREGLHTVLVEPDLEANVVALSLWTRRADVAQALTARYGAGVRGDVLGDTATYEACDSVLAYRVTRSGRVLQVDWGDSGMVRLARVEVRETARRVIIGVVVRIPRGPLTRDLRLHTERIRLRRPLGRRVVIDAGVGRRAPCRPRPWSPGPPGAADRDTNWVCPEDARRDGVTTR